MKRSRLRSSAAVVRALLLVALGLVTPTITSSAQTSRPSQSAGRSGAPPAQTDANGFKVGDEVLISTGQGWMKGTILSANGNTYRVRSQIGIDVTKTYPDEVRRIGPPTAKDRAAGQYNLHDKVQVNVNGAWVDGEVVTTLGMDYQVLLPGRGTLWANAKTMRPGVAVAKSSAPKAGGPPKPDLTSCAGKLEGRYATTSGFGTVTIVFRSGKALMKAAGTEDVELECWMGDRKVYLHKAGESAKDDMPLDINDDGTLQSPFGEMKKKGS